MSAIHSYAQCVYEGFSKVDELATSRKKEIFNFAWESCPEKKDATEETARKFLRILAPAKATAFKYKFASGQEHVRRLIFIKSFEHNGDELSREAQKVNSRYAFYPQWKKTCLIELPKRVAGILGNPLLRLAFCAVICFFTYKGGRAGVESARGFFTGRVLPFVINTTPLRVMRIFNAAMASFDSLVHLRKRLAEKALRVIVLVYGIRLVIVDLLPRIPYVTAVAERIDLWRLWGFLQLRPTHLGFAIWSFTYDTLKNVWKISGFFHQFLTFKIKEKEAESLKMNETSAFQVWLEIFRAEHQQKCDVCAAAKSDIKGSL